MNDWLQPVTTEFGTFLAAARKKAGMSQLQLAHLANIHPSYVTKIMRQGQRPSREVALGLAQALHPIVSIDTTMRAAGYTLDCTVEMPVPVHNLGPLALQAMERLRDLPRSRQNEGARMLNAWLDAQSAKKRRPA